MHSTHSPPSGPDEPASQVQTELPNGEFEFRGHAEHVEASMAPSAPEYVSILQSVHVSDPARALYFPATHNEHTPPSEPEEPALQIHAVATELFKAEFEFGGHAEQVETLVAPSSAEYVPAPQPIHVAGPASALYFPATHSEHVSPLGPVEPALHEQLVETKLPDRELEFA